MEEEVSFRVASFTDSLSACLTRALTVHDLNEDRSNEWLDICFDANDKEALFFNALGIFNPAAAVGGKVTVEEHNTGRWEELWKRFEDDMQERTRDFPLIRRFEREYDDVVFGADEVMKLK